MGFDDLKLAVLDATHLGKDALHVHIGLIIFFAAVALLRVPVGSRWPLIAASLAAIGGEVGDIGQRALTDVPPDWPAHGKDVWNTIAWPVMLTAAGRWTPSLRYKPRRTGRRRSR